MKQYLTIIAAALVLASCSGNQPKADDPLADSGRTQRTENMLTNLKQLGDSGVYLFGHQDDAVSGVGWSGNENRSDVERVCNDYPALVGFDLGGIEKGDSVNIDGVPFSRIREEAIRHFDQGGMVTISWTVTGQMNGKEKIDPVADFLNTLETPYGVKVPVVLRLRKNQTKELWHMVVDRLKEKEVTNALYAYSADANPEADEAKYMANYPGDDIIDIMGIDCYCIAADADSLQIAGFAELLDKNLTMVGSVAKKHQKAVAVTETGYKCIAYKYWWTKILSPVLAKHPISYALVWRNANQGIDDYYAPFPGQRTYSDFVRYYNEKNTLFLHDINGLYLHK